MQQQQKKCFGLVQVFEFIYVAMNHLLCTYRLAGGSGVQNTQTGTLGVELPDILTGTTAEWIPSDVVSRQTDTGGNRERNRG